MDAKVIISDLAGQQGWYLNTQFDLLCNFIDERKLHEELRKFLQNVANEENEYSLEDGTPL